MSREGSLQRLVGEILAERYRVGERLGAGAMGTVFRAEHVKIGRKLAIKFLSPRVVGNEKYRLRFEREAELAGQMRHRNVVGVLDVGSTPEGLRYLVMEYAEGRTLTELIREGPMAAPRMMSLARQLCEGLDHAHAHGLVHRDFKPDNVIVERDAYGEETPRILDFGVAISVDDVSPGERKRLTTEGMVIGTPHYMAPEQASGRAIDHRVDLFALGVTCYEMLTGVMPFEGGGVAVARAYVSRKIPPMLQRAPRVAVDPLLEAFTRALLARRRDERPPSATAARALLELIARDRQAAAEQLGVTLADRRRTLPVSPAPPPARPPARAAGGTLPPPSAQAAAWATLPTEKMPSDPASPAIAASAAAGVGADAETERVAADDADEAGADADWAGADADADGAGADADTEQVAAAAFAASAAVTADIPAVGPVEPTAPIERAALAGSVEMAPIERAARPDRPKRPGWIAPATPPASAGSPEPRPPRAPPPMASVLAAPSTPALARSEPAVPTYVMPRLRASARWRSVGIAAALVCVGLGVIAVVALRRDRGDEASPVAASAPASPPTAQPPPTARPRPAAPPPPASTATRAPMPPTAPAHPPLTPSTGPAPNEATAAPPPTAPADPTSTTPAPAPAPSAPATPATPASTPLAAPAPSEAPSAEPTAAAVAELYGAIGRALKRLDETRGQEATYDLWPRFRRIQILEALRAREARLQAHAELRYLEREIEQRSR